MLRRFRLRGEDALRGSIVLTRRDSAGCPDLSPVNAHGVADRTALCPSQPLVQELVIEECRQAAANYSWASLELVALGFAGPSGDFFESICFCAACRYGYGAVDGILETVARERVEHPCINTMLLWRRSVQYGLLQQIREAVGVPLWLRTAANLRYTGDMSSLTFEEARGLVDACTVTDPDLPRLSALPRPMPIYGINLPEHEMFAGHIVEAL